VETAHRLEIETRNLIKIHHILVLVWTMLKQKEKINVSVGGRAGQEKGVKVEQDSEIGHLFSVS
jgi:hypothetical protein